MDLSLVRILSILFIATFVRSAFGFGQALIAIPLLAFILPVDVLVPITTLISITVSAIVIIQDRQHIKFRSMLWLILFTLVGAPIGLLLLTTVNEKTLKILLSIVIVVFSSYSLTSRNKLALDDDRFGWLFGVSSGILAGAYSMGGPPIAIYGALRGWSPQHFRATLQGYFLPVNIISMVGYWLTGLWTSSVTNYFLKALPFVILGTFVGRNVNSRMKSDLFFRYVYFGLIFIGLMLLGQSLLP